MFDFWRVFIAIALEHIGIVLILREQERLKTISYQMRIEAELKKELDSLFNCEALVNFRKKMEEQLVRVRELKEALKSLEE